MRRRIAVFAIAVIGLALALLGVLWTAPDWLIPRLARHSRSCVYQVPTRQKVVALTIDDGPDAATTPRILDVLRRNEAGATFFLISSHLRGQQSIMRRLVREGHQLGNHLTQDRASIRLSPKEFETDLMRAHHAFSAWGHPVWARPGSGWYSEDMIRVMRQHLYRCALGSVYPFDAAIPSTTWARYYILHHVKPGAIVILHDGGSRGRRTARVLAAVLPELHRRGYRVVTLSGLMAVAGK
jgi:peptidoglycan/xylan/chitin deacetylase (PgdA/CDA1 family)